MPTCSASSVEKRPIRSMCAPVSSSLNSTAIDSRRTVSACAISSSESARCSSLERLSISSSSTSRRCSPMRQPSAVAAHASTTTQTTTKASPPAVTAPTAATTPSTAHGTHPSGERGPGELCRGPSLVGDCVRGSLPMLTSLPGRRRAGNSFCIRACAHRPSCGRLARAPGLSHSCPTPRRAGSRKPAWLTPLTGTSHIFSLFDLLRVRHLASLLNAIRRDRRMAERDVG